MKVFTPERSRFSALNVTNVSVLRKILLDI
ncbi:unnamed protein product [Staurois parvus]|uniref:Uncharacterized protein n=1 Tax=Staurois parvus TaxID=386267 RepID=A0ABN9FUG3_9NEOB|nr:unnamed protein product [Staurois parvus]